jgi:hypothetical protein
LPIVLLLSGEASGRPPGRAGVVQGILGATLGGLGGVLAYIVIGTTTVAVFGDVDLLAVQTRVFDGQGVSLAAPALLGALVSLKPRQPAARPSSPPPPPRVGSAPTAPYQGAGFQITVSPPLELESGNDPVALWRGPSELLEASSIPLEGPYDRGQRQLVIVELMKKEQADYDANATGTTEYRAVQNKLPKRSDAWLVGRDTAGAKRFATVAAVSENTLVVMRYMCEADQRSDDDVMRLLGSLVDTLTISD